MVAESDRRELHDELPWLRLQRGTDRDEPRNLQVCLAVHAPHCNFILGLIMGPAVP